MNRLPGRKASTSNVESARVFGQLPMKRETTLPCFVRLWAICNLNWAILGEFLFLQLDSASLLQSAHGNRHR